MKKKAGILRVFVANRREIAVRIIRACRELGIETIAAISEADRESLAVKMADRGVCIGPPLYYSRWGYHDSLSSTGIAEF